MNLKIMSGHNTPIYEQLYDQIKDRIISKQLVSGQQLPSIRGLAKETQVSVITIKKAYEDLERDGFIYPIASKGYYVKELDRKEIEKIHYEEMDQHIKQIKTIANNLDLNYEMLLNYIKTKL